MTMKKFEVEKISDLSEVFYAMMGGKPEKTEEIDAFIKQSPLKELLFSTDVIRILEYDGFFSEETVDAIYCLLPCKIPLSKDRNWLMTPQAFRKLSADRVNRPASRFIDIPLSKANRVFFDRFRGKIAEFKQLYQEALQQKQEVTTKVEKKQPEKEQKVVQKRAPRKKKWKYIPMDELSPEKQEERRAANRRRNDTYRKTRKLEISLRRKKWRLNLKENDPEKLREYDRKLNKNRKERGYDKNYFQNNKEKIQQKARENPKTNLYKRKYKNKIRFQTKTGLKILTLLDAIVAAKSR
jgi:hypothetical protein